MAGIKPKELNVYCDLLRKVFITSLFSYSVLFKRVWHPPKIGIKKITTRLLYSAGPYWHNLGRIDLSTASPPALVFMIYASFVWILIIIWKPCRSNIILLTNYRTRWWWKRFHRHDWQVHTIDGLTKLVRQDAMWLLPLTIHYITATSKFSLKYRRIAFFWTYLLKMIIIKTQPYTIWLCFDN